ncbi:thiol:disulfide interchange protein DsbD [Halopseudomonas sabulinigri]|uniref:Thiol:disulfide interchange protein DsbD n=1 Tax=Halopseudomonas sabulinigri TaxID=472181 RepID=A0A1H1QJK3_9GAMM|nr:protein-disulfide reductase DsbD [Halopseudomonas sabulinigri]SDS23640.1 thiol:disulfide interchange protein DsbD [Halopseudomonas sabulinigri]
MRLFRFFILLSLLLTASAQAAFPSSTSASGSSLTGLLQGSSNQADFLPVHEAFRPGLLEANDQQISVIFDIAPGYYLYRHRLHFTLQGEHDLPLTAQLPEGKHKTDEYFGDVEVYYNQLQVTLDVSDLPAAASNLAVGFQGCADAGLCYPPEVVNLTLTEASAPAKPADTSDAPSGFSLSSETGGLALLLFFVAGLGLTFTPCVLPMLPILSSLVLGRSAIGRGRALALALAYVLGMAVTLAIVGALIGSFGAALNIQARLQSPWILGSFALFFALFALAMFGHFDLSLPRFLRDPLERIHQRTEGGSLAGAASMGALSTLVVSPCISAPLAGALVYISTTGDALGGGLKLFALGLGMGVPLLLVALFGSALLPRSGPWLNTVKHLFGFGLLAVAIWLLERLLPGSLSLALWAALAAGLAVRIGLFSADHGNYLRRTLALLIALYASAALFGALAGAEDPLRPLQPFSTTRDSAAQQSGEFTTLTDPAQLNLALQSAARQQQPAIVDVYADWCISCKVMEREILSQPAVREALAGYARIKLDLTDNTPAQRAWLTQHQLFGPPAYLFYRGDGEEQRKLRIQGEVDKAHFLRLLQQAADGNLTP